MTPTVHYDGEVSLKLKIEISSQTGTSTIDGVAEPIISQRVVQQVIQLKDGEPSILAGLLQQQDTKSVSGTPGLGELPFLKYFFASQDKKVQTDEIVFLLIPHIVRESLLTDANTRVVDSGTGQGIQLRRSNPDKGDTTKDDEPTSGDLGSASQTLQATSAANAASAMINQLAVQARPIALQGITPNVNGPETVLPPLSVAIAPVNANQMVGSTFQVVVNASNAHDLFSAPLQVHFDSKVLSLVSEDSGELLSRDGQAAAFVHQDEGNGLVTLSETRYTYSLSRRSQLDNPRWQ
jgi:general secretion pathway protein D